MTRTMTTLLAAGLTMTLAACSANAQSGCVQPPVAQYTTTLVSPASGSTNVPDGTRTIQFSTNIDSVAGTLALTTSSGQQVVIGKPKRDAHQPGGGTLWDLPIAPLSAHTTYTLTQTVLYPAGCQAGNVLRTFSAGSFTTQ